MIERRRLLSIGGLCLAPLVSWAQPARTVYRIGILANSAANDAAGPLPTNPYTSAFLRGMREFGYVYGEHFVTEPRGADGRPERFPALAAELVGLRVDVIVGTGVAIPALKQTSTTIPIVMSAHSDPVGQGFVKSLGHPGGNITGLSLQSPETTGKQLELLKELVPGPAPVAVLWHGAGELYWKAAETAARTRGWKLLSIEIQDADELDAAFKAATDARAGAMLVFASGITFQQARRVAELAGRGRLPAMYELRPYVEAGGLVSYGPDIVDIWRRAAGYVDKILKGAKPGDLPVEQPTKFELVINLRTEKTLGIAIPQSLLLRADEVLA